MGYLMTSEKTKILPPKPDDPTPVTELIRNATKLINELTDKPMFISERSKVKAVLISAAHYDKVIEKLELLELRERQVIILAASVKSKKDVSNGNVFTTKELRESLSTQ